MMPTAGVSVRSGPGEMWPCKMNVQHSMRIPAMSENASDTGIRLTTSQAVSLIFVGYVFVNLMIGVAASEGVLLQPIDLFLVLSGVSTLGAVFIAFLLLFSRKQLQLGVASGILLMLGFLATAFVNLLCAHWASGMV